MMECKSTQGNLRLNEEDAAYHFRGHINMDSPDAARSMAIWAKCFLCPFIFDPTAFRET